ncbi:receptor activity-modifying protein 3 isoform X5 [Anolis carolinensis]|uniref:receptor activity-modifying protein 3 isoform X5 n=1 Tax=Anolis carolinensis TaxID=28377 RepID=UPI002F2B580C
METHVFRPECLFLSVLCVNGIMTIGLTGAQEVSICNESLMLQNLPECGKYFEEMMHKVLQQIFPMYRAEGFNSKMLLA